MEEVFLGGKYDNKKTVFVLPDTLDIHVPEDDRYDNLFTTFDFEALQIPIEEELHGRTLHYRHEPATLSVSICSSVHGHTDPIHLQSTGDPQTLTDDFVKECLKIQSTREHLLNEKYKPFVDTLNEREQELKVLLGIDDDDNEQQQQKLHQDDDDEQEEVQVGSKRKREQKQNQKNKRSLLDNETEVSGDDDDDDDDDDDVDGDDDDDDDDDDNDDDDDDDDDDDGDDDDDDDDDDDVDGDDDDDDDEDDDDDDDDDDVDDDGDIEDLIDDNDTEENDASFYRTIESNQPGPPSTPPPPPPDEGLPQLSHTELVVMEKLLEKVQMSVKKLRTYIEQHTVLGFNSQKYDIPLIRPYLPAALYKHDGRPKQVIKKMNGYMTISTEKLPK